MNRDAVRIATSDAAAARTGAGTAPTTSTRDSRPCTAPRANSFRPLPEFRTTESIAPPSRSMSPRRLSVSAAAICCAVPNVEIWSMYPRTPSAPWLNRMFAPRIASEPKIVISATWRCSSLRTDSDDWSCPATSARPTKFPFESYAETPSESIASCACFVVGVRRISIVLNDVPASEPTRPADANAVRPPTVSSMERPDCAAMMPVWFRAIPMSCTDPCAAFAAEASMSAMWGTSAPARPNWFIADAATSPAAATSICPAAARLNAPESAPPMMSLVDTPALASSFKPAAASAPEYCVSAPSLIAVWRSDSSSAPDAPVFAATADISASKSMNDFAADPAPIPTASIAGVSASNPRAEARVESAVRCVDAARPASAAWPRPAEAASVAMPRVSAVVPVAAAWCAAPARVVAAAYWVTACPDRDAAAAVRAAPRPNSVADDAAVRVAVAAVVADAPYRARRGDDDASADLDLSRLPASLSASVDARRSPGERSSSTSRRMVTFLSTTERHHPLATRRRGGTGGPSSAERTGAPVAARRP